MNDPLQIVRKLAPPTEVAAQLRAAVHHRQELVTESTQCKNKRTSIGDERFPHFCDPNGARALTFRERFPMIAELKLIHKHQELLDAEMMQRVEHSREGKILTSISGIGPLQAVIFLARIDAIANVDRPAQLTSYCGWVPAIVQSGTTLDHPREEHACSSQRSTERSGK